nr:hypothetical protein [Methylobacterium sp. BTF04]
MSVPLVTRTIEARLDAAAGAIARATTEPGAEPWLRPEARGRDLAILGEAPDPGLRAAAYERLAAMPGLRRLDGPVGLVEDARPFVWTATRTTPDRIDLTGNRPASLGPGAFAERLGPALPPETQLRDRAKAAHGAPPDFADAAAYAVSTLKNLQPGAHVTLEDTRLSLSGEAVSVADEASLRAALAAPPAGYTLGTVEILPALVKDFRFGIARAAGGALKLSGFVVSQKAQAELRQQATDAAEGAGITDETQTARGLAAGIDPPSLARFALQLAGLLQDGTVSFADGAIAVSGIALDGQALGEVAGLMRDGRPAGIAAGPVTLETRPLSPYRVSIRREADAVTIGGHLPDQATRERLLAALRPRFFRERIVDKSRMADGAPAGLAPALETAIAPLSLLARGEIKVADRDLTLTGDSLYAESAQRIEGDLPRALPAGWQGDVAVAAPSAARPLDPEICKAQFAERVQATPLHFSPGSGTLKAAFYPLLDGLAALAKTCPALRIEVTGHGDPAGSAPVAKPTLDTAVDSTASLDAAKASPAPAKEVKAPDVKASAAKPTPAKSTETKPAETKPAPAKKAAKAEPKPAPVVPAEPEPDLPRQRALVIVEYLLQAGIGADRIAAAPPGSLRPAAGGVGFALR